MKIDKVVWSSSVEYSDFWNIASRIHKEKLGMDSVLLLFGDRNKCDLSEEYGEVVQCYFHDDLPKMPQLVLSKFYYPKTELDTTWMIGDIDQLPLQRKRFIDDIEHVSDDAYVHLAEDAITSLSRLRTEYWKEDETHLTAFLTAHYHVAKGRTFHQALNLGLSFQDHVKDLISMRYREPFEQIKNIDEKVLWAFEEQYTTMLIKKFFLSKGGRFVGFSRPHGCRNPDSMKVDRGNGCKFDENRLDHYVDFHCPRPYKQHAEQINNILDTFWRNK